MHPLVSKLRKALRLGRMDFNEVADKGRRGEVQFIEVEGAVAVTALLSSGEFRTLHVAAVAGDLSRIPDLEAKVEEWARANGCGAIEMDGRPGWSRVDRPAGYKAVAIKYRKTLE